MMASNDRSNNNPIDIGAIGSSMKVVTEALSGLSTREAQLQVLTMVAVHYKHYDLARQMIEELDNLVEE